MKILARSENNSYSNISERLVNMADDMADLFSELPDNVWDDILDENDRHALLEAQDILRDIPNYLSEDSVEGGLSDIFRKKKKKQNSTSNTSRSNYQVKMGKRLDIRSGKYNCSVTAYQLGTDTSEREPSFKVTDVHFQEKYADKNENVRRIVESMRKGSLITSYQLIDFKNDSEFTVNISKDSNFGEPFSI